MEENHREAEPAKLPRAVARGVARLERGGNGGPHRGRLEAPRPGGPPVVHRVAAPAGDWDPVLPARPQRAEAVGLRRAPARAGPSGALPSERAHHGTVRGALQCGRAVEHPAAGGRASVLRLKERFSRHDRRRFARRDRGRRGEPNRVVTPGHPCGLRRAGHPEERTPPAQPGLRGRPGQSQLARRVRRQRHCEAPGSTEPTPARGG